MQSQRRGKPGRPRGTGHYAEVVQMRAEGLTFAEIGRRLGVTKQHAHEILKRGKLTAALPSIRCRSCAAVIARAGLLARRGGALCLACLKKTADASAAEWLIAYRLASGLTVRQLARKVGLNDSQVSAYERGANVPSLPTCERLARGLGVPIRAIRRDKRQGGSGKGPK